MKRARIISVMPATINRIGVSAIATGVGGVVVGAFSNSSLTAGIVGSIGGGMIMGGIAVCAELGTDTDPVMIPIPWPVPMPTVAVVEPPRQPAAYPPAPGQCFVCGIIDPDREKSLGTADHPECVEWLGDWKPPTPEIPQYRHPIILPSRSGTTMAEFANNLRGIMGPAKPKPTPVETTADAVRRNGHMCTVLCAHETHGDGPHDLCKCSTCVNNRGDSPTDREIREAYDDLNARYANNNTRYGYPGHTDRADCTCAVCKLADDYAKLNADVDSMPSMIVPGRLRQSLRTSTPIMDRNGHLSYRDMPPSHVLGYTAYPKHFELFEGVCVACKLIAEYHARPQWISKLPPFEPDPDLTRRYKE